jgi:hypothetical protein
MSELFCRSQPTLLTATSFHLNPRFAGSILLGGADADLIIDGILLELKTTKAATPARPELWQLAGYALADLDDEYGICKVGFYFGRHGSAITWPVGEFFDQLAGEHVDLTDLRAAFREMLEEKIGEMPPTPNVPASFSGSVTHRVVTDVSRISQAVVFRPIAGVPNAKWHAGIVEPGIGSKKPERRPACGTKGSFDLGGSSEFSVIGVSMVDVDSKWCKRCVGATYWYVSEGVEKLNVFHEPDVLGARWHRAGETIKPACGLDVPLKKWGSWFVFDPANPSDERLCGRCVKGLAWADGESNG